MAYGSGRGSGRSTRNTRKRAQAAMGAGPKKRPADKKARLGMGKRRSSGGKKRKAMY